MRGLQGESFTGDPEHVLATAKHFAAHGQPEAGTNAGPANYAERMLREELFAPYEAAVREGKIGSVMASYNEINGIPSHVNSWLLKELLRGEWGFEGFVISDGWGVDDLYRLHFVAKDPAERGCRNPSPAAWMLSWAAASFIWAEAVEAGEIRWKRSVDAAVAKVLRVKFQLGTVRKPVRGGGVCRCDHRCAEHRALGTRSSAESHRSAPE